MKERRLKKTLLLGEDKKEGILKGHPVSAGNCFWCEKEVWASSIGYTSDNPATDIPAESIIKHAKPLHKLCLLEIMEICKETMISMMMNMKANGRL